MKRLMVNHLMSKQLVLILALLCGLYCTAICIQTALASNNTTDKSGNTTISMSGNGDGILYNIRTSNYDIKDTVNEDRTIENYDASKVPSIYGIDETEVTEQVITESSDKTNLTYDRTNSAYDEAFDSESSDYESSNYESLSSSYSSSLNENDDYVNSDDNYSDYEYSYSQLAESVMIQSLKNNEEFASASKSRQEVILYAMQYVGNKYVYGGNDINNGIDCSAFTKYVMSHFGISLPRTSYEQRKSGNSVEIPKTGDLICYSGHVAIYIGDGKIIHASNHRAYPIGGIKVSSDYRYRSVVTIRSLFDD